MARKSTTNGRKCNVTITVEIPYEIGQEVKFICGHRLNTGIVKNAEYDGQTIRLNIRRHDKDYATWSIPLAQVAPIPTPTIPKADREFCQRIASKPDR